MGLTHERQVQALHSSFVYRFNADYSLSTCKSPSIAKSRQLTIFPYPLRTLALHGVLPLLVFTSAELLCGGRRTWFIPFQLATERAGHSSVRMHRRRMPSAVSLLAPLIWYSCIYSHTRSGSKKTSIVDDVLTGVHWASRGEKRVDGDDKRGAAKGNDG